MAKNRRRILGWWLLGLGLVPIVAYGCFPVLATTLLSEGLTQQGFKHVTIRLGYPRADSLQIHVLAFEKKVSGKLYQVALNDIDVAYQLSQLLSGQLEKVAIGSGKLSIGSPTLSPTSTTRIPTDTNVPSSKQAPSLTVEELLAPFPMPPFKQLILGEVSIHHSEVDDPLQHILVKGSLDTRKETLLCHIDIRGSHIPSYEITLSGTSIGNATFSVLSPTSAHPTLLRFSSETTRVDKDLQSQGSLNIDIPNVLKLGKLFFPVDLDLSQMTGTITADWSSTLPHSVSVDAIVKEKVGTIEGTIRIRAALPQLKSYAKDIDVHANGTFSATHDELTWTLSKGSQVSSHIRADQFSLPELVSSIIPMKKHQLFLNISKPLTGHIDLTKDFPSFMADGLIQGNYRIKDFPVTLQFSLSHLSGLSIQDLTAKGTFLFNGTLGKQLEPHFPVKQITWNLSGAGSLQKEKLTVSLAPQSGLKTALRPIHELLIPQADMIFKKTFVGTYDLTTQRWKTAPLVLRVNTPQVTWKDKTLAIQNVKLMIQDLKGSPATWQTAGQIVLLGISTKIQNITPPMTNWKFRFSANPQSLLVNLLGQTSDTHLSLYGRLHQHFTTQEGSFHMRLAPITFSPSDFNLRNSIKPWAFPLDITTGEASGHAEAFWTLPTDTDEQPFTISSAKAIINVDNLGGHYDNIILEGLSTTMTFVGADTWSMPDPAALTITKLETGVNISQIAMNLLLHPTPDSTTPSVEVSKFSAQMFAGKISSDDFIFDPSRSRHQLTLHAKGLDIGEILDLEQQEGLQGTGLLDGTIPVSLGEDGVEVHDGNLAARPPGGIIRYHTAEETAETLKQTNANMNLVLQALDNFHYDVLRIGANYDLNGKLLLTTKLEGTNPDLGVEKPFNFNGHPISLKGKPIHFNLNVEENIPALLKSLQIAKDIEGKIEELLQRSEETLLQGL